MKSHIAGSSMTSKANVQTAIAHSEMQQVVAVYRICTALALNKLYGFGNERLRSLMQLSKSHLSSITDRTGRLIWLCLTRVQVSRTAAVSGLKQ